MKRWLEVFSKLAAFLIVWAILLNFKNIPLNFLTGYKTLPLAQAFLLYAPLIYLFLFALYAAFNIIYGVLTFNDCEDAKKKLFVEIKEAREFMKKKGVIKEDE